MWNTILLRRIVKAGDQMTKDQEVKKNRKSGTLQTVLTALWSIFTVLVVVLLFAEHYLMDSWGELSADELVYHMKSTLDGTNPRMVWDALIRYGIPAVAVLALISACGHLSAKREETVCK